MSLSLCKHPATANMWLSRSAKLRIWKTIMRPVLAYSSEAWIFPKEVRILTAIGRKILFWGKNIEG